MEAIVSAAPAVRKDVEGFAAVDPETPPKRRLRPSKRGAITSLPLLCRGKEIGTLHCHYPAGQQPGGADITVLTLIAGQAAAAVETDRLRAAAQEKAVLDERQRLSRELHDSVSQALYGIAMGARTARELLDCESPKAAEAIDYVRQLADVGLAEMRAVLFQLRPDSLETEGLVAALAKHVDALRARYGIAAEAMLGAEPETTPEAKHALYRIAQESLHNVAKHSGARHVRLHLLTDPGTVTLVVTDDGVGFDSSGSFPGRLGLRSMRERVLEVGGTLKVDSRPGRGSRIRATVPARL
jgi:signal transduction histidine kinase